ncbi:hypothetical protein KUTeg_022850 [Tegillarca granosa]|uniref:Amino acid transporter n=1 Tax=Tegillarca granosa TaxID=220873 RepID=A0ABQ9E0X7_TEGGR|nr:hypothetical protein KUTeg_022850 [Tegillarca granosa]
MLYRFTPIGVASLIASSIAQIKDIDTTFKSLGVFVGGYTLGIAIHQLLVIPVLWLIVMRTNPFKFLLTAFRPWITVFAPPSSAVGIPEVLNTCETKHGVDTRVSRFTVLFFASMSRMGSCYFICMASLFIANLEGGNLEAVQVILITVVSSVGSLAIPSVPSASIITIIIVLSSLDISAVKVGMLMALEWYTDRLRTTSNTLNNVAGTIFIYKFCKRALEVLDMEKDKRPSHGLGVNGNVYEQTVDDDEENIMDQNRLNTTKL